MKRLRILHVVYCMRTGGTEMALRRLATVLDPWKFENIISTVAPLDEAEPIPGVRFISLQRGPRPGFLVPQLVRLFRQERPDVVHSRNWGALEAVIAARLAGVSRVIHSEHGRDINTMHGDPWRRCIFRRVCYAIADEVFTVSNELREHYARQVRFSPDRIRVIPNGVDSARFRPLQSPDSMRAKLGLAPDVLVLGTVGRLDPVKDQGTLLSAAERLLQAGMKLHVLLVGDGPERERLLTRVAGSESLRGHVTFAGEVANPEKWLQTMDIYVLPSLSEGMSNSLLEAMSTGLPCVATCVGSNPDLVEEGETGFLVPAANAVAMAQRIEALASNAALRRSFGDRARRKADLQFSLNAMVENYSRLYASNAKEQGTVNVALDGVKG